MSDDFWDSLSKFIEDFFKRFSSMIENSLKSVFEELERDWEDIRKGLSTNIGTHLFGFYVDITPEGVRIRRYETPKVQRQGEETIVRPLYTIVEDDDKVKIYVDLPGADPRSIVCKVGSDFIHIRAEAKELKRVYVLKARLPCKIDPDKLVEKKFINGVLTLVFKKWEGKIVRV